MDTKARRTPRRHLCYSEFVLFIHDNKDMVQEYMSIINKQENLFMMLLD